MQTVVRTALALVAIITFTLVATAQDITPTATSTPTESISPDPDLRSPRAAVSTFVSAMTPSATTGEIDLPGALKTLDTSEIPELVRSQHGSEVAAKLAAVLSHKQLALSRVPTSPSFDAVDVLAVGEYSVTLEKVGPNWVFSKATVADIPAIFRQVERNLSKEELRLLSSAVGPWLAIRTHVPERLKGSHFILEDWQWLAALGALLLLVAFHFVVVRIVRWFIKRFILVRIGASHERSLETIGRPIFVIILTTAIQLFLATLDLPVNVYVTMVTWLSTFRIIAFVVLGIRMLELASDRMKQASFASSASMNDLLFPIIQQVIWLFAVAVGVIQVLTVHGVNVSGLVAGLGLGGLAFALAAKDTVENIFGSAAILIDRPFKVGDYIVVSGVGGTVERIGLRTTRLRTPDNSLVSMPNSKVIASHVENLGARSYLRTKFVLAVPYETPPPTLQSMCAGIRELLTSHPFVKRDAIAVYLNEFNPDALGILVQFYLDLKDWNVEQQRKEEIFLAILSLCGSLGVQLTPPARMVHLASTPTREAKAHPSVTVDEGVKLARALPVPWNRTMVS